LTVTESRATPVPGAGAPWRRLEDDRLLAGEGLFLDDLPHDGYEAAFVRSPHGHARIVDIDVSGALEIDGVFAIYTYDDLPGPVAQPIPVSLPHPGLTAPRTPYALARDRVRYVGEPVVMVVAGDRYIAEDACHAIRVAYEPLPACVGIESALEAAVTVHDDVPDNVAGVITQQSGDVDQALRDAEHTMSFDLEIERSLAAPLEGRGVLARTDPGRGALIVHSSTQVPHAVRASLSHMLGRPLNDIDVIAPDVGGGFGMKGVRPWPEEVLVAWAAQHFGAGVRWTEDRRENFVASSHERRQRHHVTVGFDASGTIQAYDITAHQDVGAYTQYGLVVGQNTTSHVLGPYRIAAKRIRLTALYTNAAMVAPYRGAGRPEGTFVVERMMDRVAAHLGLDRFEVRRRNLIPKAELPYAQGFVGQDRREIVYDSGDFPLLLQRLHDELRWPEIDRLRAEAHSRGRRIGVGIACYVENTGLGPYEAATITVSPQGRVRVTVGSPSQGQGHRTVLTQLVSAQLGVPADRVDVVAGDTRWSARSVGTFASRGAVTLGSATHLAAAEVRSKILHLASRALEADPADLILAGGAVQVRGAPQTSVDLGTLATMADPLRYPFFEHSALAAALPPAGFDDPGEVGLGAHAHFAPSESTYASGAHGVIVETDPETADIVIRRYVVVHDCGTVINPMIVDGQIHGGVAQGVGGALYERIHYDEAGQMLNASFMDFLMPYVTEVPRVEIAHIETPTPRNPLGAKGAGEAGVIPAAAAIAAALEDAEGVEIRRMPLSPSELFELRRSGQRVRSGSPALTGMRPARSGATGRRVSDHGG
jgi:CO/xanthine dehydrogenase Mo-binding subunit